MTGLKKYPKEGDLIRPIDVLRKRVKAALCEMDDCFNECSIGLVLRNYDGVCKVNVETVVRGRYLFKECLLSLDYDEEDTYDDYTEEEIKEEVLKREFFPAYWKNELQEFTEKCEVMDVLYDYCKKNDIDIDSVVNCAQWNFRYE